MTIHFGDSTSIDSGGSLGKVLQVSTKSTTSSSSTSNASSGNYYPLTSDAITVSAGSKILVFANYHIWMQDNSNPFHGMRYIEREIGGNGSWSSIRSASTATFEYQMQNVNLNADGDLKTVNAIYTHGQSAGTSLKFRIVHALGSPGSCDLQVFQRNGNETTMVIMEIA